MHATDLPDLGNDRGEPARALGRHERRTRWVIGVTAVMMAVELVVGRMSGSMALTADGWHMATHVGALGLAAFAYWYARTRAGHQTFAFGTGKVNALAGYTSAIALAIVALAMASESVRRLVEPAPILFAEALPVAIVGLAVNIVSVILLDHDHDTDDDHNLRAAYFHVLADAFTSVLAIGGLLAARYFGWTFLDPVMGLVGAAVILGWAAGLCRGAAGQLLDLSADPHDHERVRAALEAVDDVRVLDLRLWQVAPGRRGCVVGIVSARPRETAFYRAVVRGQVEIAHMAVEVHRCAEGHDPSADQMAHDDNPSRSWPIT